MNGTAEPSAYAYICVCARAANAHGDAVIASLPVAPDEVKHRGDARGDDRRWKRTRADIWLAVVADPVADRYRLHLSAHSVTWLHGIDAVVWFDVFCEAPDGTEKGARCGYCGLERPAPDNERVVDLLNGWGPYDGICDARLAVGGLYEGAALPVTESWKYLYAPLDDLGVFVLAGRPLATNARRGGAAALGVLLKRLRAKRKLWRAIRSRETGYAEFRVQHWANAVRVDAWLTRRDLRRMAQLDAVFFYQVIPDQKPSFGEDGQCNHCVYVQPWVSRLADLGRRA